MKLRIAVLDHDTEFMNRLTNVFQRKYDDKVSLALFSNEDIFYQSIKDIHVDVLLVDQLIKIDKEKIPEGIVVGYFSSIPDVDEMNGFPAICKYQKAEVIYKMLLGMYAENTTDIKLRKKGGENRFVLFTSVQGGSGTSTAAAAYALRKASEKKKVFYLNLEKFGNANLFFTGDEGLSFSDVIYSLKSRKSNLAIKLESTIQTDPSGVNFFNSCRNAYDMIELQDEEMGSLIRELSQAMEYEEIIADFSGELSERMLMLMNEYADRIIYVSDGSLTGNDKFKRFCEVIHVIEERKGYRILEKVSLLYNRYSSKSSSQLERSAVPVIGGIHRFEGVSGKKLAEKVAETDAVHMI